ncbi:MAG: sigma-70 family RNA polymerase sigma factor [Candidatus Methylomirabilis sp.]|nr:sigma-70 family RNA polymerase sigma factor [Candidatus Methylomirabilis sp.]
MDLPDQDLVERIKGGDEAAFDALLGRYQERVYRLAMSMTRNREDAEEVLQDVFLAVYRKIESFESRSAFRTWLYRITVNAALMKLRSRGPIQESIEAYLPQFTKDGRHAQMVHDFTHGPEDRLLRNERERLLWEAIDALPPDYKVVLVLRDFEGSRMKRRPRWWARRCRPSRRAYTGHVWSFAAGWNDT